MRHLLLAGFLAGAAASCLVTPVDPGCACSAEFPCRVGEECVSGVCVRPDGMTACGTAFDGGASGGTTGGGASGGTTGGGASGGMTGGGASGGTTGGGTTGGGTTGGGTTGGGTTGGGSAAGGSAAGGSAAGGSASGGSAAGGSAGGVTAGGSTGGGAAVNCPDAGSLMRWSQCRDGFARLENGLLYGGALTVGAQNRLDITQANNPTPSFSGAAGVEVPQPRGFLPSVPITAGAVRGTVRFDTLPTGTVTFLAVRTPYDGGYDNMLDAFLWYSSMTPPGKMQLRMFCGYDTLLSTRRSDGGFADEVEAGPGVVLIDAGVDYDVTVRWELNTLCGLYLNGSPVSLRRPATGTAPLLTAPPLYELRIGNVDYDNSGVNASFQMSVKDWRWSDSVMGLQ